MSDRFEKIWGMVCSVLVIGIIVLSVHLVLKGLTTPKSSFKELMNDNFCNDKLFDQAYIPLPPPDFSTDQKNLYWATKLSDCQRQQIQLLIKIINSR